MRSGEGWYGGRRRSGRVMATSGGLAINGVERTVLGPQKSAEIEDWVDELVTDRKRAAREGARCRPTNNRHRELK